MATQVQIRRGSTAENAAFTGVAGEVSHDTQLHRLLTHDGVAMGGYPVAMLHLAQTFSQTQSISPAVNTSALSILNGSLTGASQQPFLSVAGTWDTTGTPTLFNVNITNTNSNSASKLVDFQVDSISRFNVDRRATVLLLRQFADTTGVRMFMQKRGTTGDETAALSMASGIGNIRVEGWDGSVFFSCAGINTATTEAWTSTAHGCSMNFEVTAAGTSTRVPYMSLTNTSLLLQLGPGLLITTTNQNQELIKASGLLIAGANAQSCLDLAGTWSTTGVPTAIKLDITDTASDAASLLMDLKLGGVTQFKISKAGGITTRDTNFLHETAVALADGAGASAGTITNAPAAGNPTKWIPINDNGTTRYIPAW